MKSIIIDTSSEHATLLFLEEGRISFKKKLPSGYQSSKYLIEALGTHFEGVQWIGVAQGPGLLTGVRVGIATAQGLALGLRIPVIGYCTLESYLRTGVDAAVIDARVAGAYVLKRGGEARFCSFEELEAYLADCKVIAGPSLKRISFPQKLEGAPDYDWVAAHIGKKYLEKAHALSPNYLN